MRKLVWDTSSLSYALEDFRHAAVSAYTGAKKKTWPVVEKRLARRIGAEYEARELLLECGTDYYCEAPPPIFQELEKSRTMSEIMDLLTPSGKIQVEKAYGVKAKGFSKVFRPTLHRKSVNLGVIRMVEQVAKKMGLNTSRQDITAVALAYQDNATLVTADRAMQKLAKRLGIPVIFTMPEYNESGSKAAPLVQLRP